VLVSVLIANHNHARFVRDAVESALAQTHEDTELVVVDDGSTDDSREILATFGDRIRLLLQENLGQRAALNAGFEACRGDIVCLLDADDLFRAEKVARVVDAFAHRPDACLVYHQIQSVRADGRTPIGNPLPRAVWQGDIRARVTRSGGWWPHPGTCGLAFSRPFLERVLPMRTPPGELPSPDRYLAFPAPFFGPVVGLTQALACVRLHGENTWSVGSIGGRSDEADLIRARRDQYVTDFRTLQTTLRDNLGIDPPISLDDVFRYQQYRRGAGEPVSLARVTLSALRCPALPWPMRWREAVKIALRRW
jgi:glycosyltransferase involved in cell wall biosynthesis